MKLLRLAPENTKFGFMRFRRFSYPFSAVLSIISVVRACASITPDPRSLLR